MRAYKFWNFFEKFLIFLNIAFIIFFIGIFCYVNEIFSQDTCIAKVNGEEVYKGYCAYLGVTESNNGYKILSIYNSKLKSYSSSKEKYVAKDIEIMKEEK